MGLNQDIPQASPMGNYLSLRIMKSCERRGIRILFLRQMLLSPHGDLTQTNPWLLGQHSLLLCCKGALQGLLSWKLILGPWFPQRIWESIFDVPSFQSLVWSISFARWLIRSAIIYSCVGFVYKLLHLLLLDSRFRTSLLKINNTYLSEGNSQESQLWGLFVTLLGINYSWVFIE